MSRTGMADIIAEVRTLTEAGTADYSLGTVSYWTDDQIQNVLDRHALKFDCLPTEVVPARSSGGYTYTEYYIGKQWIEQEAAGTSIFKVLDVNGDTVGTANYTMDWNVGKITFGTDQTGAVSYYVTGSCYDVNGAAADVWKKKASHYASAYDFSSDNHSLKREQLYTHALQQADYYRGLGSDGVTSLPLERPDDTF